MALAYLRRPRRSVVAALVVAGVFFGGFTLLERMQAQGAPLPGTAVVVATRDIAAGATLTRDMVSVDLAPAGAPLGGQVALSTDLPRVLGSQVQVLAPILAGEPVSRARLASSATSYTPGPPGCLRAGLPGPGRGRGRCTTQGAAVRTEESQHRAVVRPSCCPGAINSARPTHCPERD